MGGALLLVYVLFEYLRLCGRVFYTQVTTDITSVCLVEGARRAGVSWRVAVSTTAAGQTGGAELVVQIHLGVFGGVSVCCNGLLVALMGSAY